MKVLKDLHAWRLGAPSYVLPAGVEENVRYLADKVDDIQLLFFESPSRSRLPHHIDVRQLHDLAAEHDISYTVHLPTDIRAGSDSVMVRKQAVQEVRDLMEELAPLSPLSFDLHLAREGDIPVQGWQENVDHFLCLLKQEVGSACNLLAIENIDYPITLVLPLVEEYGFSLCLDFGHALFHGEDMDLMLSAVPKAAHIHYHGIKEGRDHQALGKAQRETTVILGEHLHSCGFKGVVTLEVYNREDLHDSLVQLDKDWHTLKKQ